MADLTQTAAQVQIDLDAIEASGMGLDSLTDISDTQSTAAKKSGVHALGATTTDAPTTDRAVMLTLARDADAASQIRHAQVVITEPGNMYWAEENNGVLGNWQRVVSEDATQTLSNKTLDALTVTNAGSIGGALGVTGLVTLENNIIVRNTQSYQCYAADGTTALDIASIDGSNVIQIAGDQQDVRIGGGNAGHVTTLSGDAVVVGDISNNGFLVPGAGGELTISSGSVTLTGSSHFIDTEGDAASDDLTTLSGAVNGALIWLYPANDTRTVVVKDGTGNIFLAGGDFTMDSNQDVIMLRFDSATGQYREVSRSNNA